MKIALNSYFICVTNVLITVKNFFLGLSSQTIFVTDLHTCSDWLRRKMHLDRKYPIFCVLHIELFRSE